MSVVSKEIRINVRTTQEIKDDLEIVSKLRGMKVSSIVNGAMREIIRQEKEREPQAFNTQQGGAKTARLVIERPSKNYDEKRKTG